MRSYRFAVILVCLLLGGCRDGDPGETKTASEVVLEPGLRQRLPRVPGWDWVEHPGNAEPESAPALGYGEGGGEVGRRLDEMDALAADIYAADEESLREMAGKMSRLVEWVGGTPGYANFLLARRAQDLGSIALARLLVEHDMSAGEASGILEALQSWEATPEWRAAVLDAELGTTAFSKAVARVGGPARIDRLHHIWEGMKEAVRLENEGGEILLHAAERKVSEVEAMGIPRALYEDLRGVLEAELDYGRLLTSTERWRRRQLGLIAGSSPPDSPRRAGSLIEYKELVGDYPTDPPPEPTREGVSYGNLTEVGKAFRFALSNRNVSLRNYSVSDLASETYESIKAGGLLDKDTQVRRNWEVVEAARRAREEAQGPR